MLAPLCTAAYAGRVDAFLNWWDGVELWLSGLGFVLQTIVVMPVALGVAFGLALLVDGALAQSIQLLRRIRHGEPGADERSRKEQTGLIACRNRE